MYIVETYRDLCVEIDVAQMTINRLKGERKIWEDCLKPPSDMKCQQYSDMPHGSINFTTMERIIPKMNEIDIKLEHHELMLKGMEEQKELMNIKLKGLTGLQYKIVKMKEVDNLNNIQISQRLNVSESTVQRTISSAKKRNKK